jgi:DNA polymerase-3 subunit epsilon
MPNPTIILYDFETTGLDPAQHDPIQIAAVALDGATLTEQGRYSATMRPLRPENATQKAMETHGLTLDYLATQDSPHDTSRAFASWVFGVSLDRPIPCAYNLPFDERFMAAWCPALARFWSYRKLDVMALAIAHLWLPGKIPDVKLGTVTAHLGIPHQAHDALGDVLASAEVLRMLTGVRQAVTA